MTQYAEELSFEDVTEELPILLQCKRQVPCTYADIDKTTRDAHLRDVGSCVVPINHTITLEQWRKQQ